MRRELINKIIACTMISTTLCTLVPVRASAEWVSDYQNNSYYTQDGQNLTGWKKIDGSLYYFNEDGKMQKGWISSGNSYYFLQNNGVLKTGWFKYGNDWYYSDSNGEMQTGTINVSGKVYMLGDNGVLKTNNTVINGEFFTISSDGVVAGSKVPTPDKEFDGEGNCIAVLNNADNKQVTSPTSSSFNEVIKDQSVSDDDPNEGRTFKVKFKDSNGADLKIMSVKNGKTIDFYTPTKDSNIFGSWNTKNDGSGKSYAADDSIKVKEDLNLYAQWSQDTSVFVDGITIKGSSYVTVNKTTQMTAEVSPSNATNTTVLWSVTNGTGQATIDSNGVLTGTVAGTVTVKATANDKSKFSVTKEMTVSTVDVVVPVSKISIGSKTGVFAITANGGTLQMTASVYPDNANSQVIKWSVDNIAGSAEIDENTGLLKAKSNGVVTVKATAQDSSKVVGSTTVRISGQTLTIPVASVEILGGNVINTDVALGGTNGTLQLDANVLPATASNKAITWAIIDGNEFANISSSGLITATGVVDPASKTGVIKVRATANETGIPSNTLVITISNQSIKVTGIEIKDPGEISSIVPVQFTAVTSPAGASVKSVKWVAENNTGSATISEGGLFTASSDGEVLVKAIATAIDGTTVSATRNVTISKVKSDVAVTSISAVYGENKATSINKDDGTLQMYATVLPSYASTTSAAVKWTVSGGATISDTGVLKAVSDGKVTVRAACIKDPTIYKEANIWISKQITQVTDIAITSLTGSVAVGGTLQMSASVLPTDATYPNVTWKAESGTGTADINPSSGLLTGKSPGTVTVVAVADNGTGKTEPKTVTITPKVNVIGITLNPVTGGSISVPKGTLQMSVTYDPIDPTNKAVNWSVEQAGDAGTTMDGKATITQDGLLTATGNGKVKVKATSQDNPLKVSESIIEISGQPVLATGLLVTASDQKTNTIDSEDGHLQMIASLIPDKATTTATSVKWTIVQAGDGDSKFTGRASITPDGLLTAVTDGDVKVKATGTTTDNRVISGEYPITISGQNVSIDSITKIGDSTDINKVTVTVGVLKQIKLNAIVNPTYATEIPVWSIANADTGVTLHASIAGEGVLTGLSEGVVKVTAKCDNGFTMTIDVIVTK